MSLKRRRIAGVNRIFPRGYKSTEIYVPIPKAGAFNIRRVQRHVRHVDYFDNPTTGTYIPVPRALAEGMNRIEQAAKRQYSEFITGRRPHPRPGKPSPVQGGYGKPVPKDKLPSGVGTSDDGELGPDLIFNLEINPVVLNALQSTGGGRDILRKIIARIRRMVRGLVDKINVDWVGDPRLSIGDKGEVPRGGTGYMRLLTRAYMNRQKVTNRGFPFSLYFAIPVKYAKAMNEMNTSSLKHSNSVPQPWRSVRGNRKAKQRAQNWRIVDYNGGRARWARVRLHDPNSKKGFYERILGFSRSEALRKWDNALTDIIRQHKPRLINTGLKDLGGNQVTLDKPTDFILVIP